ncbi:MAG TPA: glycosyltransferase [Terriglobales bacterium]|nr:glycosyltransferase [Terriglobales bacterium]
MISTKLYYLLKPLLPWHVRMYLRRLRARHRRSLFTGVWPIDPRAGVVPPGWPGWPEGKQFALILTHDVERRKGYERVERLAEIEARYGMRSSFNFVSEGDYRVSDQVCAALQRAGFEVGVHGLQHDDKLYSSKRNFAERAARIREYARRWNATGFRSPFMQHKLSWLHELGLEYDASTFDTDPFEPEPDAVGTIFPFWVPGRNGDGFVELPYTLAQDFTLFKVLGESTIDIWKHKLAWVAEHGGMALLNTHPDYMQMEGKQPSRDEYPVALYEEFLDHVRTRYEGRFWCAVPGDVARYYCSTLPTHQRNSRKKICMVSHSVYESDNRIRRYAEALAGRGDRVDIIALAGSDSMLDTTQLCGVNVHHIQFRKRNERSKWAYATQLLRFFWAAARKLRELHYHVGFDLIHVHNIPDFLVFAAWYPRLTGARLILDIHDVVPELFSNKFNVPQTNFYIRMLKAIEHASCAFVDHVIIANDLWFEKVVARSVPRAKCSVFLNHVDRTKFYRHTRKRNDGKFIVIFPGTFQWHQGLDIAVRAFARVREKVPNAEFHLYGGGGGGDRQAELQALARELGVGEYVKFFGSRPLEEIADVIANADLGVVPKRADSFGNEAYSTKIMEFMSQGIPVVASRTKIDQFYFDDSVVRFFPSGDDKAMADAMLEVIVNPAVRQSLIANGEEYVRHNSWEERKADYLNLVDRLTTEDFVGLRETAEAAAGASGDD